MCKIRPAYTPMDNTFVAMLDDITHTAPNGIPLIRVYQSRIVLNARAAEVLNLSTASLVVFKTNGERIWIGTSSVGYAVHKTGRRYCINSRVLCDKLSAHLDGIGTYMIEQDYTIKDYSGNTYYNIFRRKYD